MASTVFPVITFLLFVLLIWAAILFYKNPSWALAMLIPLLAWLIYDALVIALGNVLGEGSMLEVLTRLRYLLRAIMTPFLLIVAFDQASRAKARLAADPLASLVIWGIVIALVGLGIAQIFSGFGLEPTVIEGITRYKEVESFGTPYSALVTMAFLVILGVVVFLKTRTPWQLPGALLMLASLVVSASSLPSLMPAAASVILALGFLFTEKKQAILKVNQTKKRWNSTHKN